MISSEPMFVYRFCTYCDIPYFDSYGQSPLFLSPDICRIVVAKRISFYVKVTSNVVLSFGQYFYVFTSYVKYDITSDATLIVDGNY